jgi:protein-tyrosine phosphatase
MRGGLDINFHRARHISHWIEGRADLVVVMEPEHAAALMPAIRASGAQLTLAGLWSGHYRPFLQDPFDLSPEYFHTCFSILDDAVASLAAKIPDSVGSIVQR